MHQCITATDLRSAGPSRSARMGLRVSHAYLARRTAGEPVARIIGAWEFWGLPFGLSPETLVPRPDTETLVEAALGLRPDGPARIADLGTGSGCILVALLTEWRHTFGVGLDRPPRARNRADEMPPATASPAVPPSSPRLGASLAGPFDLIVVRTRPTSPAASSMACPGGARPRSRLALDGGPDGLAAYRTILAQVPPLLVPAGISCRDRIRPGGGVAAARRRSRLARGGAARPRRHPRVVVMTAGTILTWILQVPCGLCAQNRCEVTWRGGLTR